MQRRDAKQLLEKYNKGTCTKREKELVEYWFHNFQNIDLQDVDIDKIHEEMWQNISSPPKANHSNWLNLPATALVLLLSILSFSTYLFLKKPQLPEQVAQPPLQDIAPGSNKAILTLADGKTIALSDTKKGNIARQYNIVISKMADGTVTYQSDGVNDVVAYNTVSTPRGGQYSLTLSDGTKVFLNAESSLTYPVSFNGSGRNVKLEGEAYFEVAHNKNKPFIVESDGQSVEVLGTHFNINAYADEGVTKTTLLEGSIRVTGSRNQQIADRISKSMTLLPGQQSKAIKRAGQTEIILNKSADIASAMAWKNGLFQYNESSVKEVMQDAARWYDLQVIYENDLSDIRITGQISRQVNLSGLLALMRFAGAKIAVEGRTVRISR